MSELISGKEALIALANGEEVEYKSINGWSDVKHLHVHEFFGVGYEFRLKPRTITINGIEVPAPFEPKDGDYVYVISDQDENGWIKTKHDYDFGYVFGAWRTEDEIKQVVAALRKVFVINNQ